MAAVVSESHCARIAFKKGSDELEREWEKEGLHAQCLDSYQLSLSQEEIHAVFETP